MHTEPARNESEAPHPAEHGIRSTIVGVIINLLLALGKGIAGYIGNSYALIADAIESTTDIFSSLIVWWGLKQSARPADSNHPFGHGKAEPIAAVGAGLFLLFAAGVVAWQSVVRIRFPHPLPAPWTLVVLIGVCTVKWLLSRFTLSVADETGSNAVRGDAWHHFSDALTSAAAFIAISIALLGNHLSPNLRWSMVDDWAALFAAFIVAFNGIRIMRSALYELSDAHPGLELEEEIRRIAAQVPGVEGLHKCFIKKMGFDYYVELDVRVDRNLPVYRGHEIAHSVQDAIRAGSRRKRFVRVLVHIEPSLPAGGRGG